MSPIVTLLVLRTGRDDDVIKISKNGVPGLFEIVYTPGDLEDTSYRFFLDRSRVSEYLHDLLLSLRLDADPFEYIQVTTKLGPAVLHSIDDLDRSLRSLIRDMVMSALDSTVLTITS